MAPLFSDKAIEQMAKLDSELNDRLVALIPGGKQVIVEGTGHDIHVDKPEVLIAPVMEMIRKVRDTLRS
jgi:pimeloyl-ACP methyl ester carboxylesterase